MAFKEDLRDLGKILGPCNENMANFLATLDQFTPLDLTTLSECEPKDKDIEKLIQTTKELIAFLRNNDHSASLNKEVAEKLAQALESKINPEVYAEPQKLTNLVSGLFKPIDAQEKAWKDVEDSLFSKFKMKLAEFNTILITLNSNLAESYATLNPSTIEEQKRRSKMIYDYQEIQALEKEIPKDQREFYKDFLAAAEIVKNYYLGWQAKIETAAYGKFNAAVENAKTAYKENAILAKADKPETIKNFKAILEEAFTMLEALESNGAFSLQNDPRFADKLPKVRDQVRLIITIITKYPDLTNLDIAESLQQQFTSHYLTAKSTFNEQDRLHLKSIFTNLFNGKTNPKLSDQDLASLKKDIESLRLKTLELKKQQAVETVAAINTEKKASKQQAELEFKRTKLRECFNLAREIQNKTCGYLDNENFKRFLDKAKTSLKTDDPEELLKKINSELRNYINKYKTSQIIKYSQLNKKLKAMKEEYEKYAEMFPFINLSTQLDRINDLIKIVESEVGYLKLGTGYANGIDSAFNDICKCIEKLESANYKLLQIDKTAIEKARQLHDQIDDHEAFFSHIEATIADLFPQKLDDSSHFISDFNQLQKHIETPIAEFYKSEDKGKGAAEIIENYFKHAKDLTNECFNAIQPEALEACKAKLEDFRLLKEYLLKTLTDIKLYNTTNTPQKNNSLLSNDKADELIASLKLIETPTYVDINNFESLAKINATINTALGKLHEINDSVQKGYYKNIRLAEEFSKDEAPAELQNLSPKVTKLFTLVRSWYQESGPELAKLAPDDQEKIRDFMLELYEIKNNYNSKLDKIYSEKRSLPHANALVLDDVPKELQDKKDPEFEKALATLKHDFSTEINKKVLEFAPFIEKRLKPESLSTWQKIKKFIVMNFLKISKAWRSEYCSNLFKPQAADQLSNKLDSEQKNKNPP
ncbi:MAG: hypothetical protein A3F18_08635 [Legionellales bacterium RIFCSPHIGHO2_12_FULL_37_14]|nr:MAG: hypothetical protein A3F18_08635 [Legionellales bacterium RIFCSPHIGHO2_12_FULL_37_14]